MAKGENKSLNSSFAKVLGIPAGSEPIPLKRVIQTSESSTNRFDVSLKDKRTIILTVVNENLSTFYLTDLSGELRRAVVNDASIRDDGLTNLPVSHARPAFEAQKQFWQANLPPGRS